MRIYIHYASCAYYLNHKYMEIATFKVVIAKTRCKTLALDIALTKQT